MPERIALYGGSFNPIHYAHLIIARRIAEQLSLDRIVFLPSATPPHKEAETLASAEHRAQMVQLAIEAEPLFDFSDFDLTRGGPSYTIDTVYHFRQQLGHDAQLYWIVGADSLAELSTWRRVSELVDACQVITAARPGWEKTGLDQLQTALSDAQLARVKRGVLDTPMIEISSTDIRHRIRADRSIRYLVPDAVAAYIDLHQLYRDPPAQPLE